MASNDSSSDRAQILEILAQYALLQEQDGGFGSWLELFAEDATFHIFRRSLHGRQEISDMLAAAPHGIHLMGLPAITLDGDTARSITNFVFFPHEGDARTMGWYFDDYKRGDDGWLITEHTLKMCTPDCALFENPWPTAPG